MNDNFTKVIRDATKSIKKASIVKRKIARRRAKIVALSRVLDDLKERRLINQHVTCFPGSTGVKFLISASVPGFKSEELAEIIEAIESVGLTFNESRDWANLGHRDYCAANKDKIIELTLSAYVEEGTNGCRRVIVGVRNEPTYDYEWRCDDEVAA